MCTYTDLLLNLWNKVVGSVFLFGSPNVCKDTGGKPAGLACLDPSFLFGSPNVGKESALFWVA